MHWEIKIVQNECPYLKMFLHDYDKCNRLDNKEHICDINNCPIKVI